MNLHTQSSPPPDPGLSPQPELPQWTPALLRKRRQRATVLAFILVIMVGLLFAVTLVRLGANITERAL